MLPSSIGPSSAAVPRLRSERCAAEEEAPWEDRAAPLGVTAAGPSNNDVCIA